MNKFYKKIGVLTGICLIIGIILVITGTVMGASGTIILSNEHGIKIVDDTFRCNYKNMEMAPFQNMYIKVNDAKVNIVQSKDGKYGIEFSLLGDETVIDFTNENGTLVIGDKWPDSCISFNLNPFNINPNNYLTIYVPKDVNVEDINITGETCDLEIEGLKVVKNIEVTIDVGDVDIKQTDCENMFVYTDVGDVDLEDVNISNRIKATMDVGDLDFEGKISGDIDVKVDVGDVEIVAEGKETDYRYDLSVDAGGIDAFGHRDSFLEGSVNGNGEGKYSMCITVDVGNLKVLIK